MVSNELNLALPEPGDHRPSQWLGWLGLLAHAVGLAMVISLTLGALVLLGAGAAHAKGKPGPTSNGITPVPGHPLPASLADLPRSDLPPDGTALLFHTTAGLVVAPLQSTRVSFSVSGTTVRAIVRQKYRNPSEDWLDASYQFPLPEQAAVDSLRIRVGARIIEGEIQARAKAQRTFETARRAGQRAALVNQERPNVFTARIANIEPWSSIDIDIEYQQALGLSDSGWSLRFPTVVAPRYSPPAKAANTPMTDRLKEVVHRPEQDGSVDSREPMTRAVATAAGGSPPMTEPPTLDTADVRANRIQIDVLLNAGMPITTPVSPSHRIDVSNSATPAEGAAGASGTEPVNISDRQYRVRFVAEELADRDFVLNWAPQGGQSPQGSLQLENHQGEWFGQLSLAPPVIDALDRQFQPRELIFVIDTSGSMAGESIEQARAALEFGLARLQSEDRFNVIRFSDDHEALFSQSMPADKKHLTQARHFLAGLSADGGTEMNGALERALLPAIPASYLSQVVFITDGAVSNEESLFTILDGLLGKRRLFTVGIGSAPNSWFMRQAAVQGRGSFTLIGSNNQVEHAMARLFQQLAFPALTDLQLTDVHGEVIDTGAPLRDLYAGDPVIASFKLPARPEAIFLSGRLGTRPWQQELNLKEAPRSGIHKLWARAELQAMADQIRREAMHNRDTQGLRTDATDLALRHQLVSAYTSLVAVDRTPARPADEVARASEVPRQLPAGWKFDRVFGQANQAALATGALGVWQEFLIGSGFLLLAALFAAGFLYRAQNLLSVRD